MKKHLSLFLVVLALLWIASVVHVNLGKTHVDSEVSDPAESVERQAVPENLRQAIARLDEAFDQETKEKILRYHDQDIKELSYDEYMESIPYGHRGVGANLRSAWGLWEGSRLKRWFLWRGVIHPDDVSQAILEQYVVHLKGESVHRFFIERASILLIGSLVLTIPVSLLVWVWGKLRKRSGRRGEKDGMESEVGI